MICALTRQKKRYLLDVLLNDFIYEKGFDFCFLDLLV